MQSMCFNVCTACALCDVCWTEAVGVQGVVVLCAVTSLPHVHVMTQGVCVCF